MAKTIHIAPGGSAASILRQDLPADTEVVAFHDDLSIGPLARIGSLSDWIAMRESFWREVQGDRWPEVCAGLGANWLVPDLMQLLNAERIVLWSGVGLNDQIICIGMVALLLNTGVDPGRMEFAQIAEQPGANGPRPVLGIGGLSGATVKAAKPPRPFDTDLLAAFTQVWAALTASEPDPMLGLLHSPPAALPNLGFALSRLLNHYPEEQTGLTVWDRSMLANAHTRGPNLRRVLAYTLGEGHERGDLVGDAWLRWHLRRFAQTAHNALVEFDETGNELADMRVTLTPLGVEVLDGQKNALDLCGIEEWVCGVHLSSSAARVWVRVGDGLRRR